MSALAGRRILVTRSRAQAEALCRRLAERGAVPIVLPTIEIEPIADNPALDQALARLNRYGWVIFTSVNGVATVFDRLAGEPAAAFDGRRVAAIGPATAGALARRGVRAEFIPDEYVAEAIVDGINDVAGQWVLLPRADIAREALADELGRRGAVVHEIAVYRTVQPPLDPAGWAELRRGVDALTFTSASTVRNFAAMLNGDWPLRGEAAVACIGPITAEAARGLGLRVDVQAETYTMDGLVAALEAYFARPRETHP